MVPLIGIATCLSYINHTHIMHQLQHIDFISLKRNENLTFRINLNAESFWSFKSPQQYFTVVLSISDSTVIIFYCFPIIESCQSTNFSFHNINNNNLSFHNKILLVYIIFESLNNSNGKCNRQK